MKRLKRMIPRRGNKKEANATLSGGESHVVVGHCPHLAPLAAERLPTMPLRAPKSASSDDLSNKQSDSRRSRHDEPVASQLPPVQYSTMSEQAAENGNPSESITPEQMDHSDNLNIPVVPLLDGASNLSKRMSVESTKSEATVPNIFEDAPNVVRSYNAVPVLEQTKLPRGGVSMETQAVGRVQFGIPPETIKDSMRLGLTVPTVYIVPVERFCREMGPALGVNLAEFEFPAYFNFFVQRKRCTLVVDSEDAEQNIRRVFGETLLGPAQFRRGVNPIKYEAEDFSTDFPRDAIPDFQKELEFFRIGPDGKELVLETLLEFRHFEMPDEVGVHENLGIPPPIDDADLPNNVDIADQCPTSIGGNNEQNVEEAHYVDDDDALMARDARRSESKSNWTYSQARWIGDVATVWPSDATEEQIKARTCRRVEIFKMPGGTEYIMHDIDEKNHIVGKARFSGNVKVSESMSVDGFGGKSILDDNLEIVRDEDFLESQDLDTVDSENSELLDSLLETNPLPPTFHPPSFGVTVLGNSHGFDKSGSVSGYVLWINGRGVMIDPPPYSSATLEREGIRPRTIVGIILTHCHADHDAGAFQKVLTGSPVVVITTPTIYKSFIRKYAALSALSPALLRHSHRHKPAIIGTPLRFQGATFHFTYTLHSIPCVGFRVEWRGRSMVFTGDHFNSPPDIDRLQERGVLSKARADDLRNLPLQEADLLLHEAGAPPIHTPLDVLLQLPRRVKRRLYVVHTSALPEGCELRVAPTGTAGTIRLDQLHKPSVPVERNIVHKRGGSRESASISLEDDSMFPPSPWSSASNEYESISEDSFMEQNASHDTRLMSSSFAHLDMPSSKTTSRQARSNSLLGTDNTPPLVSLRPASSTDAWFILNLLSAVPFLTSLSYASTMEVLETARVDAYCKDDVIVSSERRNQVLCVVWEGTCVEREKSTSKRPARKGGAPLLPIQESDSQGRLGAVWHAGDWTGPLSLQPERRLSGESPLGATHDVVAMSVEGVKVITVEYSKLHAILKSGSPLYRKYLERRNQRRKVTMELASVSHASTSALLDNVMRNLNVLELLDCNSALRKLSAVQKRHLESLAEGPVSYQPGERLWRAGAPVDKAFVIVSGTASFVPRRRNAGSVGLPTSMKGTSPSGSEGGCASSSDEISKFAKLSLGETMRLDALTAVRELRIHTTDSHVDELSEESDDVLPRSQPERQIQFDTIFSRARGQEGMPSSLTEAHDYAKLSRGLQKRADVLNQQIADQGSKTSSDVNHEDDDSMHSLDNMFLDLEADSIGSNSLDSCERRLSLARRRSSRARFANKVLGRLYSRRAFTGGLVFSRGHFLGDVSKMVAGLLSSDIESDLYPENPNNDEECPKYGFGEKSEGDEVSMNHLETVNEEMISEREGGDEHVVHTSTLTAGKEGCVVLVFPKSSLIPFLDEYPGLLLSLLGTQVVV